MGARFIFDPGADATDAKLRAFTGGQLVARGKGTLFRVPVGSSVGVVSDFDDTIQVSNVTNKTQALKTVLLKNAAQTKAVPGAAAALKEAAQTASVVIYLSASQSF